MGILGSWRVGLRWLILCDWRLLVAYFEWTAEEDPAHEEQTEERRHDGSRHSDGHESRQSLKGVIHDPENDLVHICDERFALLSNGLVQLLGIVQKCWQGT